MRPVPFLVIALTACSIGPPPAITATPTQRCSDLRRALLGTWIHDSTTLEVRPDGSVLWNGADGTWRWSSPGHATTDVGGAHVAHAFGLMSGAQLLDVDANGNAVVWARVSIVPAFPDGCFDVRGSLVGDWTDGMVSESFLADGTYVRGEIRGNWSIPEAGYVDIALGLNVWRYRLALSTPDLAITAIDSTAYAELPRPAAWVATRIR